MLKNHFKLIFRNLLKRKGFSFINFLGLVVGMSVCLVIIQYVQFELSYDNFHKYGDRVYRTLTASYTGDSYDGNYPVSGYAQGPSLLQDYPEVEKYCRIHPQYGGAVVSTTTEGSQNQFFEENMAYVDSTFFDFFTYDALSGDLLSSLSKPRSIVLSDRMAIKYFGNTNVIGEELTISGGWAPGAYTITAVLKDIPQNTHLEFDFLLSIHDLLKHRQYVNDNGWGWSNFITYIMLNQSNDPETLEAKLPDFVQKYEGESLAERNQNYVITLQPVAQIHFTTGLNEEMASTKNVSAIYAFSLIGLFILIIAWINYINLSTARAMERSREVGIKKVVGASKVQLIIQFLYEAAFLNGIAILFAIGLAWLVLPAMSEIIGKTLDLRLTDNPEFWLTCFSMFVMGTFLSGLYPAFVLSSFKPVSVLESVESGKGGILLRRLLVIFQFGVSLALIAGTLTVYKQISYMRKQDLGMDLDQVLVVHGPRVLPDEVNHADIFNTFKTELLRYPDIKNIASSGTVPGGGFNWGTSFRKAGTEPGNNRSGNVTWVDSAFIDTYDLKVIAGRKWNMGIESDMEKVIVNEEACYAYDLGTPEEALNEMLIVGNDTIEILGVLKNYHWSSLKTPREPILLAPSPSSASFYSVKLNTSDIQGSLKEIENKYEEFFPGNPFDYFFIDEFFNRQYQADAQFGKLFGMFAILAIFVGCLGLSGLASFTVVQRTKEIGIRKVLGASVNSITILLSSRFIVLILISSVIVVPFVYWGIKQWLTNYAFPIGISWELLLLPVIILVTIAALTVSIQSIRAAFMDPIKLLRTE